MKRVPVALVIAAATSVGSRAYAQQPAVTPSDTTALAKQAQNPVGDLISVPLRFNFNTGGDLSDATLFNLNIQPVMPFKLTPDWNVIAGPSCRSTACPARMMRHHEDDRLQRTTNEHRRPVLRQREAARRIGWLPASVRHLPALSRKAIGR